ncbi:ferredoxin [uncultured Clostridium sp.]|jgi:ferredoxin|uniref:ferredoxin n=1 Tax=uncultured Clostridium sp. TaxID=59620 RepID=UPI0026297309|nr:ferredoxin [uncultured Clostridium sp.]
MKAIVDKEICIACEMCTGVCPSIFSMDADGLAVATTEDISADVLSDAEEAMDQCPVEAITIK